MAGKLSCINCTYIYLWAFVFIYVHASTNTNWRDDKLYEDLFLCFRQRSAVKRSLKVH